MDRTTNSLIVEGRWEKTWVGLRDHDDSGSGKTYVLHIY